MISRALALSPAFADAHLNLGCALQALGRLDEAAASYRSAIALRPDFALAYRNLSAVLNLQGASEAALENADRALELVPELPDALLNRAAALEALHCFPEAQIAYRSALALQPNRAEILGALGHILKELQRVDEAIACNQRAVELERFLI